MILISDTRRRRTHFIGILSLMPCSTFKFRIEYVFAFLHKNLKTCRLVAVG
uniref:Uncharacterized protein n=1 Tax=Arundo donax TaxID=35708 RepID=A0A0A9AIN2_ARUDO